MREIKFKLYDKETNEVELWNWEGSSNVDMLGFDPECNHICQYTGLKDMNGKEIYEGDIVKESEYNGVYEIRYCDDLHYDGGGAQHPGFYLFNTYSDDGDLGFHTGFNDIEVIGNIYEDSNLLTK